MNKLKIIWVNPSHTWGLTTNAKWWMHRSGKGYHVIDERKFREEFLSFVVPSKDGFIYDFDLFADIKNVIKSFNCNIDKVYVPLRTAPVFFSIKNNPKVMFALAPKYEWGN